MSNYIVLVKQVPDVTQITDNAFDLEIGSIGKGNVMILDDSAGFVNMLKIKGLCNAIDSGI